MRLNMKQIKKCKNEEKITQQIWKEKETTQSDPCNHSRIFWKIYVEQADEMYKLKMGAKQAAGREHQQRNGGINKFLRREASLLG